jgi:hypothetical protein
VPWKGLSGNAHNTSKTNGLTLSKIDALYQANVPMSIVK